MNYPLIILAGGVSSRMKKLEVSNTSLTNEEIKQANHVSKSLISIDNSGRPFLDYLLYNAKNAGYSIIYLVTGKDNEQFKLYYGDKKCKNVFHGLTINYVIQYIPEDREKPLGTADALYQALIQFPELKTKSFTVCNCDNLYSMKALQEIRKPRTAINALISYDRDMLKYSGDRISKFAVMVFDEQHYLVDIVEKPSFKKFQNYMDEHGKLRVSMNIFNFDGNLLFKYLEGCPLDPIRDEKELPTALLNMIKDHPKSTIGIPFSEHVPDLTSKFDILIVKEYVKNIILTDW